MRRNAIVLLVVLVVCAAGAEVFFRSRAASERERIRSRMGERGLCTQPADDERLIYTYTPGECGANSLGYRDIEHSIEKPEGVFRIVLIGDSVAEGRDVEADSAFGRVIERQLNARGDGRRYEVILLAHIGYSTSQEIVLLHDTAFRYDPDLILWSYCLNDPAHPVYHNANGDLGRYYHRPRSYLVARVEAFAFRVKQKYRGLECPKEFHAFVHCAFWPEVEENLGRIGEITLSHRVPVVFVIHPIFEKDTGFEDYSLRDVHARLAEAARTNGFDVVDLLEPFRAYAPAGLKIENETYYDPWHMNALGHRVAARAIAPHIP
ncbi:MAG TPA: SGNH/GDSL hydrolase family protein [Candidatus Krumholzibacteria bacterium]|nr:SGNH/GDSL hydrolase family protein [Candidatus Krumholzibacteria bacterium]